MILIVILHAFWNVLAAQCIHPKRGSAIWDGIAVWQVGFGQD